MSDHELPKAYDPTQVESKWYDFWLKNDFFHADAQVTKTPFSIVIPPPNITGSLHMGHALGSTIQDLLTRWQRMHGHNALWLPGTDHAGIATQITVERELARSEKKTRHDLGRAAFVERTWAWKEKHGRRIVDQMKAMGFSLDWARERFTMDEGLSRSVRVAFVQLYNEGLIYRARRLINWCTRCQTALSDLEVDVNDEKGSIWHISYGDGLVVATTRPETMLGDTAVAVHPDDERYKHLIGKDVELPLTGRRIPVIADAILVDKEFGTGAVKVTPGHDFNDFETGVRHNLPAISILDAAGKIIAPAPEKYWALDVQAARKAVLADLAAENRLVDTKDHTIPLGRCERCGTVVEPFLSLQWFVKVAPLAEPAIAAVEDGRTRFVPENWVKTYMNWMRNLKDWCISRQLWWGHRIPAWTCTACKDVIVALEPPTECPACHATELTQDEDVLDTWFSSSLWPFSTLGWPEKTRELATFYPTSVLVTGFDIIFFWVARMMMMGLHFTGKVPFRVAYIHALVVDENGDKMSKTKGNGIDPLDVVFGATKDALLAKARDAGAPEAAVKNISKTFADGIPASGADALRFTLAALAAQGRNIRLSVARVEGYRHFANKIWNASRFALMNLDSFDADPFVESLQGGAPRNLSIADRWILSRLQRAAHDVDEALQAYRVNDAAQALYRFIWNELCDWYIELAKPALQDAEDHARRAAAQGTLAHVLETALRLLHPFMPFITEEIWQKIPKPSVSPDSIMITLYPVADERLVDAAVERDMGLLVDVAVAARAIRSEYNVPPSQVIALIVRAEGARRDTLATLTAMLERSTRSKVQLVDSLPAIANSAKTALGGDVEVMVPLAGLIDIAAEKARLLKEVAKAEKEIAGLDKKLGNSAFVERAPAEVVDDIRARLADETARAGRLRGAAALLEVGEESGERSPLHGGRGDG